MKSVLFLLVTVIAFNGISQNDSFRKGRCNTTIELHKQMEKENPQYVQNRVELENFTKKYVEKNTKADVVTIPVVVHIIHDGDDIGANENISEAQILSQIQVLNEDYGGTNANISNVPAEFTSITATDPEIQFCLAQQDPDGFLTTGIVRYDMGRSSWNTIPSIDNTIKSATIWDRDKYLNIWVVQFGGFLNGVLGFAQFPGFPSPNTDGIVITYEAFGRAPENPFTSIAGLGTNPFNGGRTASHEVGHWLNLLHSWGDGGCSSSDSVSDTPTQVNTYMGCISTPQISCGSSDAYMTFLSEVDDACMLMFTNGQKMRMHATLNSTRASLLTSNGCVPGIINSISEKELNLGEKINLFPNPASAEFMLDVKDLKIESITLIDIVGKEILKNISTVKNTKTIRVDINDLQKGVYIVRIKTTKGIVYKNLSIN